MCNIAVIGGGGSWVADTVGRLYATKPDYDVVIGTSGGSAIAAHVALGKYEKLVDIFSSLSNSDVFSVYPFTSSMRLNLLVAARQLILTRDSLGDTKALYRTLMDCFTEDEYQELKASGKDVVICYNDLEEYPYKRFHKLSESENREDFIFHVWVSCCITGIASVPLSDRGTKLTDGGLLEPFPIRYGLMNYNCRHIDGYTHMLEHEPVLTKFRGALKLGGRAFLLQRWEAKSSEVISGKDIAALKNIPINIYNMTHEPDVHPAQFTSTGMSRMIHKAYAKSINHV